MLRQSPCCGLVAEQFQQLRARPDEGDAGLFAGSRQGGILRKKAVAGVDRIDPFFARQRHDAFHIEIGFHRPFAFADQVGFVGFEAVQGQPVFLGINRDGAQSQFIGGAEDTNCDFAAVQCQKFFHVDRE